VSGALVTVCVPARNHARHLGAALASALTQDVDGLELLVGDDASTDATGAVVAALRDPRVRYLRHPRALGVAANRNSLLAVARGRYVAWLDADDELLPGALAGRLELLEQLPEVAIAHGDFDVIDEHGAALPAWPPPLAGDLIERSRDAFGELICANEFTTSTVIVRRSAQLAAGGFEPRIGRSSTDWHGWLRVALRGDVAYSAAPVARYRQHAGTITRRTVPGGERLRCDVAVVGDILRAAGAPHALRARARAALAAKALLHAGDAYTSGRRGAGARAIALAARLAPGAARGAAVALLAATVRGDDAACHRLSRVVLARLAERLGGTRAGRKLSDRIAVDPDWSAQLETIAATVGRVVPAGAHVAAVTKWDPTLLALAGRRGRNFPDRALLPDGYPPDGATAVAHLEALRGDGVTHLVLPSASFWWLEHYRELDLHLAHTAGTAWRDEQVAIFDLGARP